MAVLRLILPLVGMWTATNIFAQDAKPMIGTWQCATQETARDGSRTVGKFKGSATLELHADQTITGESVPDGDRPWMELTGRWTADEKRLILQLAGKRMGGSVVREKLILTSSTNGNRDASVSTSWTCTKAAETAR